MTAFRSRTPPKAGATWDLSRFDAAALLNSPAPRGPMATHGRPDTGENSDAEFVAIDPRSQAVSAALAPELIHANERLWVFALECIPGFQISHRAGAGVFHPVGLQRASIEFESEERQSFAVEKLLDPRNGEPMLLHVEQQISASADAVEVRKLRHGRQRCQHLLAAAADVGRCSREATLGD